MIRKVFCLFFMYIFSLSSFAQGEELVLMKGDCMQSFVGETSSLQSARRAALNPMTNWDANKIYKQMVVLFSFSDVDFLETHSREYYQQVFNEEGYIEREGKGCVADYFREQSGGLVNFEFDIYGPVQVSTKAQPYDAPNANTRNYGKEPMMEALRRVLDENPTVDFSQYDWNGDSIVEQVIFVYAGIPGNVSTSSYGHIWPNTGTFSTITTPDGFAIFNYTASGERYPTNPEVSCGIGTICHEFCHSLGLPDIYPTGSSNIYTAVDEWDLMDGGNFTNLGWCPPNFSAMEKMLLGWLTPVELTEPTTITDMKSVSNGGAVYQIKHTDTEYLLLENRQQDGWDKGNPGKGLLIYHVNYNPSAWNNNRVNAFAEEKDFLYQLVHADNMTYDDWDNYLKTAGFSSSYANSGRMNKLHLSTSAYPYETNNEFSDTSDPAAQMQTENADGLTLLSKALTNIQVSDDGLVSFDFMGGDKEPEPVMMSYVVNEVVNDSIVCTTEGEALEGTSVSVPYHRYNVVDGKLYMKESSDDMYDYIFTLSVDGQEENLEYDETEVENVVYLAEGEEIEGLLPITTMGSSNSAVGYAEEDTEIVTLEAGVYALHAVMYDAAEGGGEVFTFKVGDQEYTLTAGENCSEDEIKDITLYADTPIILAANSATDKGLDVIYIVKTGDAPDIPDGIDATKVQSETGEVYNLQGQKISKAQKKSFSTPLPGQVYIIKKKDGTTYKYIQGHAQ